MAYVKNAWYAAGWIEEFGADKPDLIARTLLDQPLVMFRLESGEVAALLDRCPHRGVPLSMGTVKACRIQCAYHGLEFDETGTCVHNPHIKGDPGRLGTRRFATKVRHDVVWLWNGDPDEADVSKIPDFSYLVAPGYAVIHGIMHVKANFRLVLDNLLDLSHAEYIHRNTVGTAGSSSAVKSSISLGENQVTVNRKVSNLRPSPVFQPFWKRSERTDQRSNMTWYAPSNFKLNLSLTEPGGEPDHFEIDPDEGFHFPSAHLLTPQSESETTYFYAVARNFMVDDQELSQKIKQTFAKTFEGEDLPVLEGVQRRLDSPSAADFKFADFTPGDGAASKARKMIDKLLAAP